MSNEDNEDNFTDTSKEKFKKYNRTNKERGCLNVLINITWSLSVPPISYLYVC